MEARLRELQDLTAFRGRVPCFHPDTTLVGWFMNHPVRRQWHRLDSQVMPEPVFWCEHQEHTSAMHVSRIRQCELGTFAVSGSASDKQTRLYRVTEDGEDLVCSHNLGLWMQIQAVALHPDGLRWAVGGDTDIEHVGKMALFTVDGLDRRCPPIIHVVYALDFDSQGRLAVLCERTIEVFEEHEHGWERVLQTVLPNKSHYLSTVRFDPTGEFLAVSLNGKSLNFGVICYNVERGTQCWARVLPGWASGLCYSPCGGMLAVGNSEGLYVLEAESGATIAVNPTRKNLHDVDWSREFIIGGSDEGAFLFAAPPAAELTKSAIKVA